MSTESPQNQSAARALAYRLSKVMHDYLGGRITVDQVAKYLRQIADWIDRGQELKKGKESKDEKHADDIKWLFAYWVQATGRDKASTKLTPNRKTKLTARLAEGYSRGEIKKAIDAIANSQFHQGQNENARRYDDLELICRNGDNLEKYRDMSPKSVAEENIEPDEVASLRKQAREALRTGDTHAYDIANKRLAQLTKRKTT